MLEGPIGAASFNNEFGRPNILGYFRTYEQATADGDVRGYHNLYIEEEQTPFIYSNSSYTLTTRLFPAKTLAPSSFPVKTNKNQINYLS
jgi:hypothetical protein